jgi:PAS domain S-box-containing protein
MPERLTRWRIQNALYALVLCALCPILPLLVAEGVRDFNAAARQAEGQAMNIAWSIATQQKNLTENTRNLLDTLARLPEMKNRDAPVLEKLFAGLIKDDPNYTAFFAFDTEGRLIASDIGARGQISVSDRKYFQDAMRTGKFSPGEYVTGRLSQLASFHFAAPVFDDNGEVTAVAAAAVRLDSYDAIFSDIPLPAGWRYVLQDRNGVRLHRYPRDDRFLPGMPDNPVIHKRILESAADHGLFRTATADGAELNVAFAALRLAPGEEPYMTVLVAFPKLSLAQALIDGMGPALSLLLTTLMLALLIARILGRKLIGAGVEQLTQAARALASGDLSARAGDIPACQELTSLGQTFDTMAETLSQEITQRREAVAALEQAETKYRTLVENSPVGVYRATPAGRYLLANQTMAEMLGYASAEELVRDVSRIGLQIYADRARALELLSILEQKGFVANFEAQNKRKDGSLIWTSRNCRAVKDDLGRILYWDGFVSDITERKELEGIREDVDRILRHDLRAPLQGILAVPAFLSRKDGLDPEERQLLGFLTRCGHRMLHMINMSLEMFKIETGSYQLSPAPIDIVKIVRDAADEMHVLLQSKDLGLEIAIDGRPASEGDAFVVDGEEPLCFTMLENLLRNAFEAAPRGSAVAVSLTTRPPEIRITNAGEVPAEIRDAFFTKYTTQGKKEGTGLGAYSAMRIAKTHGFGITLDASRPGETTLVISPPNAEARFSRDAGEDRPEPGRNPLAGSPPLCILLAEDSDTTRAMLTLFLQDDGHEVACVQNGLQALETLPAKPFDLILLDMMMPELDGPETAARIRSDRNGLFSPDIAILGITASDAPGDKARCLAAGMDEVIPKPVKIDELRQAIARVMDMRRRLTGRLA